MQFNGLRGPRWGAPELGRVALATAAAVVLVACGRQAAVPPAPPVPEVGVLKVEPRRAPLLIELVGDVRALREVELRPRLTGVVEKQLFTPGQMVREGQPLFLLDTRALDSGVADAQARLIEAEAQLQRAQQDVARYQPLLADDAIARQTYDQAVAAQKQAESLVESRREGVTRARIDRGFAEVRAPVTGQIGLQKVEVGGLASAGQTVLAVVSTLDPVVVYFSVSETEYLEFSRRLEGSGRSLRREPIRPMELLLADGSKYSHAGRFDFADRAVNPQTGTLTLRAVFPNPEQLLRPGMTGRVRLVYDVAEAAIVLPQKAVTELLGRRFVAVVGPDGKVEQRAVRTGNRLDDQWLIEDGLKPGETVVVEGVQKARAGAPVKAVPVVVPEVAPEVAPTASPTALPTASPTVAPNVAPNVAPTAAPGAAPGAAGAAPAPAGAARK